MAKLQNLTNDVIKHLPINENAAFTVKNQLGQKEWVIINSADGKKISLWFSSINEVERLWAQKLILEDFAYQDKLGTLRYPHATVKSRLDGIKKLLSYLNEQSQDKQSLKSWTTKDLVSCIQSSAVNDYTLLSISIVRRLVSAIKTSYIKRYEQDGIAFNIPDNILQQAMTPICKKFDLTYSQWERGGSHDMVPMSVGTLLLADAIKLIRSKKCQLLQCYFNAFRDKALPKSLICNSAKSIFKTDIANFLKPSTVNHKSGVNAHAKYDGQRVAFVNKLRSIDPQITDFPFKSQKRINSYLKEIEGACLTILLAVTAMRISECHSVCADWVESIEYLDVNGVWTKDAILKSKIIKTGGGIIAKRGLSPLGIEVFELLNKLSWVDKKEAGIQLFSPTYTTPWMQVTLPKNARNSVVISTLRRKLQAYYQKFVIRAHHSVAEAFPHIKPHNLRHFKMAFALRKFDGDVESELKQEFRHHGHHTQAYSRNKLNEEEIAHVKQEYVQNVIKRILINDPNDKWVGPATKQVRSLAETLLNGLNIEMLSLEQLSEFHQNIYECVHSMTFHSYGICFVLNDNIKVAKCGVKDNIVKAGAANSKLCHGCTNFGINNKSHEHNLKTNKARWEDVVNCEAISRFPIVSEAKAVVKNIEKLQAALEVCNER